MSELNELHDYENRPKKKNPFRSKPIPKSRIEWAIRSTLSIRAASQHLGIAYNTFKKYAKMYNLFDQNKNQRGKGITTKGNTGWGVKIQDLFDCKHPKYPHCKLQERIVRDGFLKQECSNCGYDDYRENDMRGPYLICFLDNDSQNHSLDNLYLLCYNCFYIVKPTGRMLSTPKNVTLLRKKLEEVWVEKEDE
jgi:transposase-like protein